MVKKKEIKKTSKIVIYIILLISVIVFALTNYISETFSNVSFEQLLFSVNSAEGTSTDVIINGFLYVFKFVIITCILFFTIKFFWDKYFQNKNTLFIKIGKKTFEIVLFRFSFLFKICITILIFLASVLFSLYKLGFFDYIESNINSNFIEENYVNPSEVKISAPEEKQNLIFIYVESLETSLTTMKNGGALNKIVLPNLERLALDNVNFSNTNTLGGAFMPYGTNWTIAGMVGSSTGLPIKISINGNNYFGYGEFLPGAYGLGDVLADNGYNNYLLLGSDASFGGRLDYYHYHGNYKIYDYNYAKKKKWIDEDYYEWWGFEDSKLYKFAKNQLKKISENDEPFNFTILTADTHFTDGYIDKSCPTMEMEKYMNSYYCTDYLLNKFIEWVQEQDFYKNTTIVIVGDHLSMQSNIVSMFEINDRKEYVRTIYNAFINSRKDGKESNLHNRQFTTFDFYPTTLSSLGFTIEGDRLALGTDLFSDKETLSEQYGNDTLNKEMKRKSKFYNKKILINSYKKMKETKN